MKIKKETIVLKIDVVKATKGRIEPGTHHGSRPHRDKTKYTRKGKTPKGGEWDG